jgi:hypothetical protein
MDERVDEPPESHRTGAVMVPRPLVLSIPPVKNPPGSDQLLHRVWTQFDEDQRQTFIPNPHLQGPIFGHQRRERGFDSPPLGEVGRHLRSSWKLGVIKQ